MAGSKEKLQGGLTRRECLQLLGLVGASVAVGGLAGCAGENTDNNGRIGGVNNESLLAQAELTENTLPNQVWAGLQEGLSIGLSEPDISELAKNGLTLIWEREALLLVDYVVDPGIVGGLKDYGDTLNSIGYVICDFYDMGQAGHDYVYCSGGLASCDAGAAAGLCVMPKQQVAQLRSYLEHGELATDGFGNRGYYCYQGIGLGGSMDGLRAAYGPIGKLATSSSGPDSFYYMMNVAPTTPGRIQEPYDLNFFVDPGVDKDYCIRVRSNIGLSETNFAEKWRVIKMALATLQGSEVLDWSDDRVRAALR